MKILFITGENDYDALEFESRFEGKHVDKLIKIVETKGELPAGDEHEYSIPCKIVSIPDIVISKEFRDFIKHTLLDYDAGKHTNFYLSTDIISQ